MVQIIVVISLNYAEVNKTYNAKLLRRGRWTILNPGDCWPGKNGPASFLFFFFLNFPFNFPFGNFFFFFQTVITNWLISRDYLWDKVSRDFGTVVVVDLSQWDKGMNPLFKPGGGVFFVCIGGALSSQITPWE